MIRTYVKPETNQLILSIPIPEGYVGKELEVVVKKPEEAMAEAAQSNKGDVKRFLGALKLTDEQAESLDAHLKAIRDEWDSRY